MKTHEKMSGYACDNPTYGQVWDEDRVNDGYYEASYGICAGVLCNRCMFQRCFHFQFPEWGSGSVFSREGIPGFVGSSWDG